jgi:SOS-response transcriptional repressor LexA
LHSTTEAVYRYIIRHKRMHAGESPTRREIGAAVGLSTPSTVNHHLVMLERAGRIRLAQPAGKARMIAIPGASWHFDEVQTAENGANKCAECDEPEMTAVL